MDAGLHMTAGGGGAELELWCLPSLKQAACYRNLINLEILLPETSRVFLELLPLLLQICYI